ncbi:MAG: zinc metallopeptidase [Saprospiraceae bacterium]
MGLIIISVIFMIIGFVLSSRLKSKFRHYAQIPLQNGMSGAEVAAAMLKYNQIYDVKITQVDGELTDHYNPSDHTVNLSHDVYHGRSVAAAAVAAHECGHAVQHATAYSFLQMRSSLVPIVNIAAGLQQYLFMFAIAGMGMFNNKILLVIALAAFGVTTLFSLITLPVEFDASKRALVWLDGSGFARGAEYDGAKDALTWAAMTYVSAALAALVQFLYLLWALLGSRD